MIVFMGYQIKSDIVYDGIVYVLIVILFTFICEKLIVWLTVCRQMKDVEKYKHFPILETELVC